MQIVYHLGVHCTDEDMCVNSLRKNVDMLAAAGVVVPAPRRFRPVLREAMKSLQDRPVTAETEQLLLDSIMDEDNAERLVLSHESFLSTPPKAIGNDRFYPLAEERTRKLRNLFPSHPAEFFLGLRNPATFLPALFQKSSASDFASFLGGSDPAHLRWSGLIARLIATHRDAPITVWSNEDTPLIWPQVLLAIAGQKPGTALDGVNDLLGTIMTANGLAQMEAYLATHPAADDEQRRRVVVAFLDKYARDEAIEMELDIPGWTTELVDAMTEAYEDDLDTIARMQGVRFISA